MAILFSDLFSSEHYKEFARSMPFGVHCNFETWCKQGNFVRSLEITELARQR